MTSYDQYGGNPYSSNYETQAVPAYGQSAAQYEMSSYGQTTTTASSAPLSQGQFLERVDQTKEQIRQLRDAVGHIGTLQQRALASPQTSIAAQIEGHATATQTTIRQIRDSVKFLEKEAAKDPTAVKLSQSRNTKSEFVKELKAYQAEEQGYRRQYQDAQKRQWKIVNPDATEDELNEVAERNWGTEGVFATAMKTNRRGDVTATLGNVQSRHDEIQRIEKSLMELAAMFEDLSQIVEAQEPAVENIDNNAQQTADNVEAGNKQVEKGIENAKRRRRLQWWCALIVVLIVLGIALGVGLGIGLSRAAARTATGQ